MRHTDIGKLAIFKDHEVVLLAQLCEADDEVFIKVFNDIDVTLTQIGMSDQQREREPRMRLTLTKHTLGPAASTILRKFSFMVTSTLTQRLVFFLSITSNKATAAGFKCDLAREP